MTQIKKSFINRTGNKKEEKNSNIFEFGAIIENKEENYPKTGNWSKAKPLINNEKCAGCGICAMYCPEDAIRVEKIKGKKKIFIDYRYCKGCGICSAACPNKAIKVK